MTLAQDFVNIINKHQVDYMVVGLKELIVNKTASGRSQDITDLKDIKKINLT
jgi:hypothetical protein